jgi:hypothetical protein
LLSVGTMATCKGCCHLTGAMLNLAAEAADRARINVRQFQSVYILARGQLFFVCAICLVQSVCVLNY